MYVRLDTPPRQPSQWKTLSSSNPNTSPSSQYGPESPAHESSNYSTDNLQLKLAQSIIQIHTSSLDGVEDRLWGIQGVVEITSRELLVANRALAKEVSPKTHTLLAAKTVAVARIHLLWTPPPTSCQKEVPTVICEKAGLVRQQVDTPRPAATTSCSDVAATQKETSGLRRTAQGR